LNQHERRTEDYFENGERFATSVKEMYDELENAGFFKNHPQLFLTGLAIGIITGRKSGKQADTDIIKVDTYASSDPYGVFPVYLLAENEGITQKELARLMESYADGGVEYLYEEYKDTSEIDFSDLLRLAKK